MLKTNQIILINSIALVLLFLFIINSNHFNANTYFKTASIISSLFNSKENTTIFCFIKTHPDNFHTRLNKSYENCIRHCTDYRYVTVYDNKTINLKYKFLHPKNYTKEIYGKLTDKVYQGLLEIKTLPPFDWYLFADDDTFINMNNLYSFLRDINPMIPLQYGHHFSAMGGFLSGGAGYVFSKEAYKRVVYKLSINYTQCQNTGIDDLDLSKCLQSVNATIGDSRDEFGLERFHSDDFEKKYFGPIDNNGYDTYKQFTGKKCCSKSWISFHEKNFMHFDNMIEFIDGILRV